VCILKAFAGLEYFTFSQWRTAQWDWTLEEPASQTPVMCGGVEAFNWYFFSQFLWSMAKVLKVGYENCSCWTEALAGKMRRAHVNGKGAEYKVPVK
jgi:hypothetical protein